MLVKVTQAMMSQTSRNRPFCRKFFNPKTRMESDSLKEVVKNFKWTQEWSQIAAQDYQTD